MEFLKVLSREEVLKIIDSFVPLGVEEVTIEEAYGRVIAERVVAVESVPHFKRATMDGYAVRARDTFGASETLPAFLRVIGKVEMGKSPEGIVGLNEAMAIATGAALPEGSDAVVMVEHTERIDEETIEVYRPVAPGQHVLDVGEDIREGDVLFEPGKRLRPQDIGVLSASGITSVKVYRKPRVAIVSTGDEIVSSNHKPPLPIGVVRDVNTPVIAGLCKEMGALVGARELVSDDLEKLESICKDLITTHDVLLISGGSSVGARDFTLKAIERLEKATVIFHGVAIKPGKPTIFGKGDNKYIWGLPGHPSSSMMVMISLVCPFLKKLGGERLEFPYSKGILQGRLVKQVPSVHGREDYILVNLIYKGDEILVDPIFAKSGMIFSVSRADGFIIVPEHAEGIDRDEVVKVYLL